MKLCLIVFQHKEPINPFACELSSLWLCDCTDCSPPGSSVHGIFQAKYCSGLPFSSPGDLPDAEMVSAASCISCIGRQILYHWATWSESVSRSVVSDSLQPHGLWPARFICPWDFPDKNTGVGSHFLLQRIFLAQRSSLGLLHCRWILYPLSYQGSHLGSPLIHYWKPIYQTSLILSWLLSPMNWNGESFLKLKEKCLPLSEKWILSDIQPNSSPKGRKWPELHGKYYRNHEGTKTRKGSVST